MLAFGMDQDPTCPTCQSPDTYADGSLWVCPACGHEWDPSRELSAPAAIEAAAAVKDANGNVLRDGDSVTVIKDLKVKGSSSVVKVGTKVRNIRLTHGDDGHDIACKIDGIGAMNLKSEFVRKA
jgi:protein PhnA